MGADTVAVALLLFGVPLLIWWIADAVRHWRVRS